MRERPVHRKETFDLASFWRTFLPRGATYRNFYLVLLTRGLVTMGIYSIFTFFQFFLKDILHVADPPTQTSYLIAIIIAAGVPTGMIGGMLSDRHGRKPFVYLSGGLMALASIIFIGVAFFPSLPFTFAVGALFGLGYGAYQAVDWALAIDVLPKRRRVGEGHGHLARLPGAAPGPGAGDHRPDAHRAQARGTPVRLHRGVRDDRGVVRAGHGLRPRHPRRPVALGPASFNQFRTVRCGALSTPPRRESRRAG